MRVRFEYIYIFQLKKNNHVDFENHTTYTGRNPRQTRSNWSKSVANLLPCSLKANIRMRSLLRRNDNKSASSCQQV